MFSNGNSGLNKKRILIAGCGDIGLGLAAELASEFVCYGLRRSPVTSHDSIQWIQADLTQATALQVLATLSFDTVVYLPTPQKRNVEAYEDIFINGFNALWQNLVLPPARLIFVSSTAVYGDHDGAWIDESTASAPTDFNGEVLLEAEANVRKLGAEACAQVCVVRFGGIYGPGRTRLIEQVLANQVSTGSNLFTNRIHALDAARVLAALVRNKTAPALIVNGVDNHPTPKNEVLEFIATELQLSLTLDIATQYAERAPNRRIRGRVLDEMGFVWVYPDFRAGYAALIHTPISKFNLPNKSSL